MTKCADVKGPSIRFFAQIRLGVPSTGAANFADTQCRAEESSVLSSSGSDGSREKWIPDSICWGYRAFQTHCSYPEKIDKIRWNEAFIISSGKSVEKWG